MGRSNEAIAVPSYINRAWKALNLPCKEVVFGVPIGVSAGFTTAHIQNTVGLLLDWIGAGMAWHLGPRIYAYEWMPADLCHIVVSKPLCHTEMGSIWRY
jgi:hypothetical protein